MSTRRDFSFSSSALIILLLSVYSTVGQSTREQPYRNLYGRDDITLTLNESVAGIINGGDEFLVDSGNYMFEEPPDVNPRSTEGEQYDFIIVGAGTAGATIASRLSEIPDVTVLLIEAGPSESLIMDIPVFAFSLQLSDVINWKYQSEPSDSYCLGMDNHQCNLARGKVMGGSSILNLMAATRGNRKDYDVWAQMGNDGWSWSEVLPYFKKLETMGNPELANDTEYHNVNGPVYTNHPPFRTPLAGAFVQAGVELGYNEVDYNGRNQTGYSLVQSTIKNGTRMGSSRAYLHPARNRPNLFVTKESLATRILMDRTNKRAIGVEFVKNNTIYHVHSKKEVILSAGAIGSPQLLMLSGIGPADHLQEMGIELLVDAPVGENLMDHIAYGGLVFTVDQPVSLSADDLMNPSLPYLRDFLIDRNGPFTIPSGLEAVSFINVLDPDDLDDYPNIELVFLSISAGTSSVLDIIVGLDSEFQRNSYGNVNTSYAWTIYPMLMRPKSRGTIRLRDNNINSHPRITPNYMTDPEDVRILVEGIRAAVAVSKTQSMQYFGSHLLDTPLNHCQQYENDSDEYWECAVRTFTMTIYHYSGTCKMGPQGDPTAVVDPRLKVMNMQGLRVADASIMPVIITGHLNIPTYMIGEKLSDMVKQDWGLPTTPLPS